MLVHRCIGAINDCNDCINTMFDTLPCPDTPDARGGATPRPWLCTD